MSTFFYWNKLPDDALCYVASFLSCPEFSILQQTNQKIHGICQKRPSSWPYALVITARNWVRCKSRLPVRPGILSIVISQGDCAGGINLVDIADWLTTHSSNMRHLKVLHLPSTRKFALPLNALSHLQELEKLKCYDLEMGPDKLHSLITLELVQYHCYYSYEENAKQMKMNFPALKTVKIWKCLYYEQTHVRGFMRVMNNLKCDVEIEHRVRH
jgi:hypothetical protein